MFAPGLYSATVEMMSCHPELARDLCMERESAAGWSANTTVGQREIPRKLGMTEKLEALRSDSAWRDTRSAAGKGLPEERAERVG